MPVPSVPLKTPLGQDELRNRSQRLGQRHRTVLFLVDGRRTLAEVLSLAHQAGAQTVHFEDLVRLGLVELPPEPVLPEAPDPVEAGDAIDSLSGGLDAPRLTSVAMDVPEPVPALATMSVDMRLPAPPVDHGRVSSTSLLPPQAVSPSWLHAPVEEPIALEAAAPPRRHVAEAATPARVELVDTLGWADTVPEEPVPPPPPPPPPKPAPKATRKATSRGPARAAPTVVTTMLGKALGRGRGREVVELPPVTAPVDRPSSEQQLIAQVRELLLATMRIDAPVFAALTLARVHAAQTQRDLIGVVWEIERHRVHARLSREELISLQQARELLGMGNTLVAGDSPSDRHDDWPTTQPPA